MTSRSLALLLADLGVVKTHSRPHVSNGNPFSEAHFKTMKYRRSIRIASGQSRMRAVSATSSFPRITTSTITQGCSC